MTAGIQKRMLTASNGDTESALYKIGKDGCYFLCLLHAGDPFLSEGKIVDIYKDAIERGFIDANCYVKKPVEIVRTYGSVNVRDVAISDTDMANIYGRETKIRIACYTHGDFSHFVLQCPDGTIWDSLGDSETVKHGKITSYRFFY